MNSKRLRISVVLSAALLLTLSVSQASVETTQAPEGGTKTTIRVNGHSADMFLIDDGTSTNGFLNASKDRLTNTSALDFSYVTPEANDPDIVILIQGAGEIPNSSFTITSTTAHLQLTTPFPVTRCVVNINDGTFTCALTTPRTFDLTWTRNGFGGLLHKVTTIQTLGPVTTKVKGQFTSLIVSVDGTWDGHQTADGQSGNLVDSHSKTVTREVSMDANP